MQYHMFTGCQHRNNDSWLMFLYEDANTCVQTWKWHPKYGMSVLKKDTRDIPIEMRIFILSTTQDNRVSWIGWEHKEVTEQEAMERFYEYTFLND